MTQAIGPLKRKGRPELERLKRRLEQVYENHNAEVEARICGFRDPFMMADSAKIHAVPIDRLSFKGTGLLRATEEPRMGIRPRETSLPAAHPLAMLGPSAHPLSIINCQLSTIRSRR